MRWLTRMPASVRDRLPLALAATVFVIGSPVLVGPCIFSTLQAGNEAAALEGRAASMRRLLKDAGATAAGEARAVAELEKLVSARDRVPEVIEVLARLAFDPRNPAQSRGLLIEAGRRASLSATAMPADTAGGARGSLDPRWALFPGWLEYTPITVTFDTTYHHLGLFLWRLRDLPTLVEVRSVEIGRSLPLSKVKLVLLALQRTNQAPTASLTKPVPTSVPVSRPGVPAVSRRVGVDPMKIPAPPVVDLENEPVWSRDPFLAAGESRQASARVAAGVREPARQDPVITSILYAADRRLVVIDHRTLRVGDSIAAGVIVDIQPTGVVIRLPSGELRRVEMTKKLTGRRAAAPGVTRSR